jgi:hypothetical protein
MDDIDPTANIIVREGDGAMIAIQRNTATLDGVLVTFMTPQAGRQRFLMNYRTLASLRDGCSQVLDQMLHESFNRLENS